MRQEPGPMPVIDAHCHVFPDAVARRAVESIHAFYGYPVLFDGRVDTLLEEMAHAGVAHCVVSGVAITPHQVDSINTFIADTVKARPGAFTGLGALHPDSPDLAGDVERLIARALAGVKVHPDIQRIPVDDPRFLRLFALCEGRLPVCCHCGDRRYDFSNPNRVARVLKLFPRLTFIGAHMGGWMVWNEAAELLGGYDNLLVDTSSTLCELTGKQLGGLISAYGADRVLFGTDYPLWSMKEDVDRFNAIALTEAERKKILYQNAAALYAIPCLEAGATPA